MIKEFNGTFGICNYINKIQNLFIYIFKKIISNNIMSLLIIGHQRQLLSRQCWPITSVDSCYHQHRQVRVKAGN
jgi:hypothetical protein